MPIWTAVACKQVSLPLCVRGGSVGGLIMQCAARASRQRSHSPTRVTLLCPSPVGLPPLQGGPGRRAVPVRLRLADSPTVAWRDCSSGMQAPSDYPPAHAHASARSYSRAEGGGDGYKSGGALCKLCTWNEEEKQRKDLQCTFLFSRAGTEGWRRHRPPRCRSRGARSVTVHSAPLLFMVDVAPASRARL